MYVHLGRMSMLILDNISRIVLTFDFNNFVEMENIILPSQVDLDSTSDVAR